MCLRHCGGARLFESTFGMSYETALWAVRRLPSSTPSWVGSRRLDRHRAGEPDDFRPDPDPGDCDLHRWWFGESLEVIKQKSIENVDMLKGLNFVAIVSLMGWGLGYFGQPHIWRALWRPTLASFMRVASV